jgi:hypothetical protein
MSNPILNLAWTAPCRTPAAKLVLVRLADMADASGVCWPSIERIAKECAISERSVPRAIQANVTDGHLSIQRTARTSKYRVHPCHHVTPDIVSATPDIVSPLPLTPCQLTPDTMSPKPIRTSKEPSITTRGADALTIPASLNAPTFQGPWNEWVEARKAKRGVKEWQPFFQRQLDKQLAPLGLQQAIACLEYSITNGYMGLFPDKFKTRRPESNQRPEEITIPILKP